MRSFESERFETQLGPFAYDRLCFAVQGARIRGAYLSGFHVPARNMRGNTSGVQATVETTWRVGR